MRALLTFVSASVFALVSVFASQPKRPATPVLLDYVHYYLSDRQAAEEFFINHFGARTAAHPGKRPLDFITFLSLRAGEGTINVSPRGPIPGIEAGDPDIWQREVVEPSPDLPPVYGVHWVAIRTVNLNSSLTQLEFDGVRVTDRRLTLPYDILARAVLIRGPDFNHLALVERKGKKRPKNADDAPQWGDYAIDHLLLLVKSADENEKFFQDVYAGRVTRRRPHITTMKVANATIVLAEPEGIGLKRQTVQPRDPKKFRFGIDNIGFLYEDVKVAVEAAKAKGYKFLPEGVRMNYFGEPTVYTVAATLSPDGLQCEMAQQDGRIGPRTKAPAN